MDKAPDAFRTISEVADDLDIPQHVLRFWETRFSQIKPMKRSGGRRYYRPDDVDLLRGIRRLLYGEGYTIRGVQRILREQGVKSVQALADAAVAPPSPARRAESNGFAAADEPAFDIDEADEADDSDEEIETDEDGLAIAEAPPQPVRGTAARVLPAAEIRPRAERGMPQADAARLRAALDDLTSCKKLIDDALKTSAPELFPLKP